MSTQNLLTQSVHVAGEEIFPTMSVVAPQLEKAKFIPIELRTKRDNELILIWDYMKKNIPLVNLAKAISAGGIFNDSGLPRLAVAHYKHSINEDGVEVSVHDDGVVYFSSYYGSNHTIRLPEGTLPRKPGFMQWFRYPIEAHTEVPVVPYELRQKENEDVWVLFEVSAWERVRVVVDPYLLKHVAGYVYAILGTWEVTETELKAYNAARDLGLH